MSTGLPRPGLARSAHGGRIRLLRGYVISKSSAALNPLTITQLPCELSVRGGSRTALLGPSHQLAVRMRINNCTHAIIIIMAQATCYAPCASNCACAEGLHFSAFHSYIDNNINGNVAVYKVLNLEILLYKVRWHVSTVKECNLIARS